MKHLERIADSSTPPTSDDMIYARQRTAGVTKSTFTVRFCGNDYVPTRQALISAFFSLAQIDGKPWEVTDAGGQPVEQRYISRSDVIPSWSKINRPGSVLCTENG